MVKNLPKKVTKLIDNYLNLAIGNYKVKCPYFQNTDIKSLWPVDLGKGLPSDIEDKTERLIGNPNSLSKNEILKKMINNNIGIDCSGLAVRIIDLLLKVKLKTNIRAVTMPTKRGFINFLRHRLRTYTNLSANTLTSDSNCNHVTINNVLPGDMIRAGKEHVGVITKIERVHGLTKNIWYIHSINGYKNIGVVTGKIKINNPKLKLEKQVWAENADQIYMLKEYLHGKPNDRGIRRLKAFSLNKQVLNYI